ETTWAAYVRKKKEMIPQGRACRDCMQLLLDVWPGVSWGDHATKYTANIDDHKTKVDMAKEIKLKKIEAPFNQAEVRSTETVGSYLYWDGIVLDSDQFTKKFLHTHEGIPDVMEISLNRNLDGTEEKAFVFQDPDQPYRKIRFFSQCDLSKSIGLLPAEKHLVDGQARAKFDSQMKLDVGARIQQLRGNQFANLPTLQAIEENVRKVKADEDSKKNKDLEQMKQWEERRREKKAAGEELDDIGKELFESSSEASDEGQVVTTTHVPKEQGNAKTLAGKSKKVAGSVAGDLGGIEELEIKSGGLSGSKTVVSMNTARSPAKGDAPSDPKGAVEYWMNRVDIDDILRTGAKLGKDIFQAGKKAMQEHPKAGRSAERHCRVARLAVNLTKEHLPKMKVAELKQHLKELISYKIVLPQSHQLLVCATKENELRQSPSFAGFAENSDFFELLRLDGITSTGGSSGEGNEQPPPQHSQQQVMPTASESKFDPMEPKLSEVDGIDLRSAVSFIDEKYISGKMLSALMAKNRKAALDIAEACAKVLATASDGEVISSASIACRCVIAIFHSSPGVQRSTKDDVNIVLDSTASGAISDGAGAKRDEDYFNVFKEVLEENYSKKIGEFFKFTIAEQTQLPELTAICNIVEPENLDAINQALKKLPVLTQTCRAGATSELEMKTLAAIQGRKLLCVNAPDSTTLDYFEGFMNTVKLAIENMPQKVDELVAIRTEIATLLQNRSKSHRLKHLGENLKAVLDAVSFTNMAEVATAARNLTGAWENCKGIELPQSGEYPIDEAIPKIIAGARVNVVSSSIEAFEDVDECIKKLEGRTSISKNIKDEFELYRLAVMMKHRGMTEALHANSPQLPAVAKIIAASLKSWNDMRPQFEITESKGADDTSMVIENFKTFDAEVTEHTKVVKACGMQFADDALRKLDSFSEQLQPAVDNAKWKEGLDSAANLEVLIAAATEKGMWSMNAETIYKHIQKMMTGLVEYKAIVDQYDIDQEQNEDAATQKHLKDLKETMTTATICRMEGRLMKIFEKRSAVDGAEKSKRFQQLINKELKTLADASIDAQLMHPTINEMVSSMST
ncbi:unnamed protein product, partial [Prorocentrum cordatum]